MPQRTSKILLVRFKANENALLFWKRFYSMLQSLYEATKTTPILIFIFMFSETHIIFMLFETLKNIWTKCELTVLK